MSKVCCFGEPLLRLSPALGREWIRTASLPVFVGGAELNVARALALWDIPVSYCSVLPDHYLSAEIIEFLGSEGIDTSAILKSGPRIGIYYLPQGADMQHRGVIYDRANSSFAGLQAGMLDWEQILKNVSWFHFSAICPALAAGVADTCEEALLACRKKGILVSLDLNYRARLWKYGESPVEVMKRLAPYAHLMMGNIWSASDLLGIPVDPGIHEKKSKQAYLLHGRETALKIIERYPSCQTVASTFRFDEPAGLRYYACLDTRESQWFSREWEGIKVVDRVGSGDCFMAGLIYGHFWKKNPAEALAFAAAAAVDKLQEQGDATTHRVEYIESTLRSRWPEPKI